MSVALLHQMPTMREGFLKKTASSKGEDVFRGGWQDRYFKLFKDRLEYYKQAVDNTPQGEVDLRHAIIDAVDPKDTSGAMFCIKIQEAKQVWIYLQAGSGRERDDWIRQLRVAAGVEEDVQDTVASVAAVSLSDRKINLSSFTVLHQDTSTNEKPELVTLALGTEGMIRIYKEAKLWRTYEGSQIADVKSTLKPEFGIGIGPRWRHLCEIQIYLKVAISAGPGGLATPTVKAGQIGTTSRYNIYLGSVEETEVLLPLLQAISRSQLQPFIRLAQLAPVIQCAIELRDTINTKSGYASRYAWLTEKKLILFKNSNDPSPFRAIFLHPGLELKPEQDGVTLSIEAILEKDPISIRLNDTYQREQWQNCLRAAMFQNMTSTEAAHARQQSLPGEKHARQISQAIGGSMRIGGALDGKSPKAYKPLTLDSLMDLDSSSSSSSSSHHAHSQSSLSQVVLSNLNVGSDVFDFDVPEALDQWKQTEPSFVLTFGGGACGQLGHRTKDDMLRPTLLDSLKTKPIRSVACTATSTVLVTEQGHVYTMGQGYLGLGERMMESKSPYLLTSLLATPIRTVACGRTHTIAITGAGTLLAWGGNTQGQLGLGHCNVVHYPQALPTLPQDLKVLSISAGGEHSACIVSGRELYVWGSNAHGCLGLGDTEMRTLPTRLDTFVENDIGIAHVSCGQDFTLITTNLGIMFSTGLNNEGQLGLGDRAKRSLFAEVTFFPVHQLRVIRLATGSQHSSVLALNYAGETAVYTFGAGISNGFREAQVLPTLLGALVNTRLIISSSSSSHTLTLNSSARPFAFGLNQFGELGNGTAGVQALVKIRLASAIQVVQAATGGAFSVLLCKGTPPENVMHMSAAIPPPPAPLANSTVITARTVAREQVSGELRDALGLDPNAGNNFGDAIDQIQRLLQYETSLDRDAIPSPYDASKSGGASDEQVQTVIERGEIEVLNMTSIHQKPKPIPVPGRNNAFGQQQQQQQPAHPSYPLTSTTKPISTSSTYHPTPAPTSSGFGVAPMSPSAKVAKPPAAAFTFTTASTAAIPIMNSPPPSSSSSSSSAPALPTAPSGTSSIATSSVAAKIAAFKNAQPMGMTAAAASSPPAASPSGNATMYLPARPTGYTPAATTTASPAAASASKPMPYVMSTPLPSPPAAAPPADSIPPPPSSAVPPREKKPLPLGWKKVPDPTSGRSYYYNSITKQTQWKKPRDESQDFGAPPPPPPEDIPPPPSDEP